MSSQYVLTLSCPDRAGIVHAVTSVLVNGGCDITEHQQFDDSVHGLLFLRTCFDAPAGAREQLEAAFATVATAYEMKWQLHDATRRTRVLVMASKFGHCLNDLLFRWRVGSLGVEHRRRRLQPPRPRGRWPWRGHAVLPRAGDARTPRRRRRPRLLDAGRRASRSTSSSLRATCRSCPTISLTKAPPVINIHHGFLPAFQGARPYTPGSRPRGEAHWRDGPLCDEEISTRGRSSSSR